MTRRWGFAVAVPAVLLVMATLAVALSGDTLPQRTQQLITDLCFIAFPALSTVAFLLTRRSATGRMRRARDLLTGTTASWTVGNVWWFYYQFLAPSQPFPTPADAFYLLALGFAAAALLVYPSGSRTGRERLRTLLDALIVGGSILFVNWQWVLADVVGSNPGGLAGFVVVAYPLGDILLAALAIVLVSKSVDGLRLDLVLVAIGFFVYAVADSAYTQQTVLGTFQTGTPLDLGWMAGYLLLGLAALAPSPRAAPPGEVVAGTRTSAVASLLVYLPLLIAVAVGAAQDYEPRDAPAAVVGALVLVLFGIRQAVLAADNAALRRDLEDKVVARTRELERLSRQNELILESMGEGIYGVDTEGRVTFANTAALRMLGYDAPDLLGQRSHAAFHDVNGDGHTWAECYVARALADGVHQRNADETYRRADGSAFRSRSPRAPSRPTGRSTAPSSSSATSASAARWSGRRTSSCPSSATSCAPR